MRRVKSCPFEEVNGCWWSIAGWKNRLHCIRQRAYNSNLPLWIRILYSNVGRWVTLLPKEAEHRKAGCKQGFDRCNRWRRTWSNRAPLSWPLGRGLRNSSIFVTPLNHMPAWWKKRAIEIDGNAGVIGQIDKCRQNERHGKYVCRERCWPLW